MMYFGYDRISSHWIWTRWEDWGAMCHWYGHPSHNQNPNERFQIPCEMDTMAKINVWGWISCEWMDTMCDGYLLFGDKKDFGYHVRPVTMSTPNQPALVLETSLCMRDNGRRYLAYNSCYDIFGIFNHPRKQPDWNRLEAPNNDDDQWFMMDHDQYDSIQN